MKEIIKKTYSDMFNEVLSGKKNFDLRLNDFEVEEGDILILKEVDKDKNYTGREIRKKVGFVLKTNDLDYWTEEEKNKKGFVVMGLKEI